jgi:quercetin dioxygenase-like cupin family protein
MAIPHAKPGEIIDIRPLGANLGSTQTTALVKTGNLEVIRLVIPAGKEIPSHKAPGEITVQCLEGRVVFTTETEIVELTAGQLLFLTAAEPHALKAIDDSSLLVTLLLGNVH